MVGSTAPGRLSRPSIGGLNLEERIGAGGFGAVYRARDSANPRRSYAVKVLHQPLVEPAQQRRFAREYEALRRLADVAGVVTLHGAGIDETGQAHLVTDLYRSTVGDRVRSLGRLDPGEAVDIAHQAATALAAAHRLDIIHGDVKPGNLFIDENGRIVLGDFGAASLTDQTVDSAAPMSVRFSAPEVLDGGPPSAAGDLYGLGATLHHLLTGQPPTIGGEDALDGGPDAVPAGLADVVRWLLARSPQRRPPSARAAAEALAELQERGLGRRVGGRGAMRLPRGRPFGRPGQARPRSMRPVITGVAVATGLAGLVALAVAGTNAFGGGTPDPGGTEPTPQAAADDGQARTGAASRPAETIVVNLAAGDQSGPDPNTPAPGLDQSATATSTSTASSSGSSSTQSPSTDSSSTQSPSTDSSSTGSTSDESPPTGGPGSDGCVAGSSPGSICESFDSDLSAGSDGGGRPGWTRFGYPAKFALERVPDGFDGPGLRLAPTEATSDGGQSWFQRAMAGPPPGQPVAIRLHLRMDDAGGENEWLTVVELLDENDRRWSIAAKPAQPGQFELVLNHWDQLTDGGAVGRPAQTFKRGQWHCLSAVLQPGAEQAMRLSIDGTFQAAIDRTFDYADVMSYRVLVGPVWAEGRPAPVVIDELAVSAEGPLPC